MLLPRATATPRRRVFGTSHRPQPLRLKITPLEARNTLYNPCHLQLQGPKSPHRKVRNPLYPPCHLQLKPQFGSQVMTHFSSWHLWVMI